MKFLTVFAAIFVLLPWAAKSEEPAHHVVEVVTDADNLRMYFNPKILLIEPGDTVTWKNLFKEDHNVVTYPDGFPKGSEGLNSPFFKESGDSWSHTFAVEGTYDYHCIPHILLGMHGSIVVGKPSKDTDYHIPNRDEVAAYRNRLIEYFDNVEMEEMPDNIRSLLDDKTAAATPVESNDGTTPALDSPYPQDSE